MAREKVSEHIYVESFARAQGWELAPEDIERRQPPEPDFVLHWPGGRLQGVEVTELAADDGERTAGGSRLREEESFRARWMRDLADLHYEGGGRPITLQVILNHTHATRPPEVSDELRDRFLALMLCSTDRLRSPESERIEVRDERTEALLATLHIHRLPDVVDPALARRWQLLNDRVGWVRTQRPDQLQSIVDEKAGHLAGYQTATSSVVLLIVANHFVKSGMIQFAGCLDARGFDSVFLLHYPDGEVQVVAERLTAETTKPQVGGVAARAQGLRGRGRRE